MEESPLPPKLSFACPKLWSEMQSGGSQRRFCQECQLHVHDLSAMTKAEGQAFLAQAQGRTCVSYLARPDGTLIVRTRWQSFREHGRAVSRGVFAVLATLVPFLSSACTRSSTSEGYRTGGVYCEPADGKDSPPKHAPKQTGTSAQRPSSSAIVNSPPPDSASAG